MPLYEYHCPHCGAVATELRKIGKRNDAPICDNPRCWTPMKLVVSPVAGKVINPAHQKKERARHYRDAV